MSCCGSTPEPQVVAQDAELRAMIDRLRERRKALRSGDGFSHAGTLIGAYKRTLTQLEALLLLVETQPKEEEPQKGNPRPNPECYGQYGENLPSCQCKAIAERLH